MSQRAMNNEKKASWKLLAAIPQNVRFMQLQMK